MSAPIPKRRREALKRADAAWQKAIELELEAALDSARSNKTPNRDIESWLAGWLQPTLRDVRERFIKKGVEQWKS